jgi:hypothetical protein
VTPNSFQPTYGGGTNYGDGFLTRLDPSLPPRAQLTWSTYFGIGGDDGLIGLGVERSGFVTAAGWTDRNGFPATPGAFSRSFNGGPWDGVVARFDPRQNGGAQLVYSSYFGGSGKDFADSLTLDAVGNAVVTGLTNSPNYPTTPNVPCPSPRGGSDIFVTVFDMLPTGVTRYGTSTPACAWPIYAGVNSMPAPGNQNFAVLATGAAPNTVGALFLGVPSTPWPLPPFPSVQVLLSPPLLGISAGSDALGFAELNLPIPASYPGVLPGLQWIFLTSGTCPGSGPLSASDGLR